MNEIILPIWALWIVAVMGFGIATLGFLAFLSIAETKIERILTCGSYIVGCFLYWSIVPVMISGA